MNNYDQSSTGNNIELFVEYDEFLATEYFKDFEAESERLRLGRDSSVFLIGDVQKPFYKVSQLRKMTKDQLIKLDDMYELLCPSDYDDVTKAELVRELADVTILRHYEWLASECSWHEFGQKAPNAVYITRGYCQGDAEYVVSVDAPFTPELEKYIDHTFWDQPVYMRVTVNDVDFDTEHFLDNIYEYDKTAVAEKVKALPIAESAKEWVIENLPQYPKYN